jgi:hypothetical protein
MLPSRVMIAAEQQRCVDIVSDELNRMMKEYELRPMPVAETMMARIIQRIRRVE